MSTDRELLELAAKAAGVFLTPQTMVEAFPKFEWDEECDAPRHEEAGGMSGTVIWWANDGEAGGTQRERWDPLNDDGDALRLAVRLQIDLVHFSGHLRADARGLPDTHQMHDGDPYAATRRAIVRAAAALAPDSDARDPSTQGGA